MNVTYLLSSSVRDSSKEKNIYCVIQKTKPYKTQMLTLLSIKNIFCNEIVFQTLTYFKKKR